MQRKRSTSRNRSIRRLSSMRIGKSRADEMVEVKLPTPNFELEDVLVSQLQISDVMNNCVRSDLGWTSSEDDITSRHGTVYHRCYHDTVLVPLWQAFSVLDGRGTGKVLLGRLMNMSSALTPMFGANHKDTNIQKHFIEHSQVPFNLYKDYVLTTLNHGNIDAVKLSSVCWSLCKQKFLNNPLVDNLDSVVPAELAETMYWLFCIFNKLTEPDTYPPSMDYEETELFLRKLTACLGLPWSGSTHDNDFAQDDSLSDKTDSYCEPSSSLMVTFQQFLSIISDVIGIEVARGHQFYRAVQRLCLIEYCKVMKTGWLSVRKQGTDVWRKRWAVLHGSKLTCYTTLLCQYAKTELKFKGNMHVESLPGTSYHKHKFRIVEKEGFKINSEFEFAAVDSKSAQSWISLINIVIRMDESGMSAKTSEICERRLERHHRRESEREVFRKKKEVFDTFEKLQIAKKARSLMEATLNERAAQREAQMVQLVKMDKIYERLETIQLERRLLNKNERHKQLTTLFSKSGSDFISNFIYPESDQTESEAFKKLHAEESTLEHTLEILRGSPAFNESSNSSVSSESSHRHVPRKPSIVVQSPKAFSASEKHSDYFSSCENMSTSSTDYSLFLTPFDASTLR